MAKMKENPCKLVEEYFLSVDSRSAIGLHINGNWYGRPWDEYWIFQACKSGIEENFLEIKFDYAHLITCHFRKIWIDEEDFLCIDVVKGELKNFSLIRDLSNDVLKFVHQKIFSN